MVPVDNSSGGFSIKLIDLAIRFSAGNKWILVAEPAGTGKLLSDELSKSQDLKLEILEFETAVGVIWTPHDFEADLCSPLLKIPASVRADVVITQALLEHVVDPVMVIRNLLRTLDSGGLVVIHTHNPLMKIHRFPIDTLRFNEDWFVNLSKYLDVSVVHVEIIQTSIYCVLRKL